MFSYYTLTNQIMCNEIFYDNTSGKFTLVSNTKWEQYVCISFV